MSCKSFRSDVKRQHYIDYIRGVLPAIGQDLVKARLPQ